MFKRIEICRNRIVLAERAQFADNWLLRLRGMIGRSFRPGELDAMVFEKCSAVHCCWMREAIDVLFVDRAWQVVKVCHGVKPWRIASGGRKAWCTLEFPAGKLAGAGIRTGDVLNLTAEQNVL